MSGSERALLPPDGPYIAAFMEATMPGKSIPAHVSCPVCGKPARRTYCSSSCHATTRRRGEDRRCACCGKPFYVRPSDRRKGGGVFCSLSCRKKYKAENGVNYLRCGTKSVHRIVAAATLGRPLLPSEIVHHKDHDKKNNTPENLQVIPNKSEHHRLHARRGEDSEFAILTWRQVREIRRRRAAGESATSLAKEFNIHTSNVRLIVRGKTWKEIKPSQHCLRDDAGLFDSGDRGEDVT